MKTKSKLSPNKYNPGFKLVFVPQDSKIIVYICELGEKKTNGGIILMESIVNTDAYKQTTGIITEIKHISEEDGKKCGLELGDTICFPSYAGLHKEDREGKSAYRILKGHEIHAIDIN